MLKFSRDKKRMYVCSDTARLVFLAGPVKSQLRSLTVGTHSTALVLHRSKPQLTCKTKEKNQWYPLLLGTGTEEGGHGVIGNVAHRYVVKHFNSFSTHDINRSGAHTLRYSNLIWRHRILLRADDHLKFWRHYDVTQCSVTKISQQYIVYTLTSSVIRVVAFILPCRWLQKVPPRHR